MALVQRDYILRLLEQIAAAISQVLKLKTDGDLVGARQEVRRATMELLGPASAMAMMVDPRTAANLVSDPRRLRLWARLLEEDSALLREMQHEKEAAATDLRIVQLLLESWSREKEWDDDIRAVFAAARGRGGDRALDAAYKAALAEWEREQP